MNTFYMLTQYDIVTNKGLTIADDVLTHLVEYSNAEDLCVQLSVEAKGCSGLYFSIVEIDTIETSDYTLKTKANSTDITFVVKEEHVEYIDKIDIQLEKENFGKVIRFKHPDAVGYCGCGESVAF